MTAPARRWALEDPNPAAMRSTFFARCLRALPVYGFAVLLVVGIAQTMQPPTVVAAESVDVSTPTLRLTVLVGLAPIPVLLPVLAD